MVRRKALDTELNNGFSGDGGGLADDACCTPCFAWHGSRNATLFFIGFALARSLDATHHWFSTIFAMAAMFVLMRGLRLCNLSPLDLDQPERTGAHFLT
jgi:hypothetical protein